MAAFGAVCGSPGRCRPPSAAGSASGCHAAVPEMKGQAQRVSSEILDSRCDFVLQDAGGEWVMLHDCPEFGGGGDDRRGGVKAVEGYRSPSPGGTTVGHGADAHRRGLRLRVCEADRRLGGMREIPESRYSFISQDTGGELLMSRDCPVLKPTGSGAAAPGYGCAREGVAQVRRALTAGGPRVRVPVRKGNCLTTLAA